jgi:SAM-dependent methyltransferase
MALSKSNPLLKTESRPAVRRRPGCPVRVAPLGAPGRYALATGEAAAYRLHILHALYGPGSRRVLLDAGLQRGMRVADLGCGVGMVTALLAELVGPEGHVVGIDASAAQLAQARERLPLGRTNIRFVEASATRLGPDGSHAPAPDAFSITSVQTIIL